MADLKPDNVTIVVDSREQRPYDDFAPMKMESGTLPQGDYSVRGLEHICAVERKSLEDLLGCIGKERARFERELLRLSALQHAMVVVEAPWSAMEVGQWRARISPTQAQGSILGWTAEFQIPFHFSGCRSQGQKDVARFLYIVARRRWREGAALRELVGS